MFVSRTSPTPLRSHYLARTAGLSLLTLLVGWRGLDLAIHEFAALIPLIVIALALSAVPVRNSR
jgi:hypothetical protein